MKSDNTPLLYTHPTQIMALGEFVKFYEYIVLESL